MDDLPRPGVSVLETVVLDYRLDIGDTALAGGYRNALMGIAIMPEGLGSPILLVAAGTSKTAISHFTVEVARTHVEQVVQLNVVAATTVGATIARAAAEQQSGGKQSGE